MLIYCNGDSFTSGHGLGDFLLPNYPGDVDYPANKAPPHIGKWAASTYSFNYTSRQNLNEQIHMEESNRCWPAKLKKYGHDVINSAQSGSSMQRISRTTIADLIELKKTNTDILAIISVPPIDRSEIYHRGQWVSFTHAYLESCDYIPHLKDFYSGLLLDDLDGYASITRWYLAAIQVKDYCKVNNIPLLWINSLNPDTVTNKFNDVNNLVKYLNIKYDVTMAYLVTSTGGWLPDGHFSEKIHDRVAQILDIAIKKLKGCNEESINHR